MLKIKKILLKYWHWLILIVVSAGFFIGASSFNYYAQSGDFIKWLSPDESANYNFTKLYAQTGRLTFFERYNLVAGDIMHPRSYRSDWGWLKPVSFLGIILIYGKIAGLFGYKVIPFLTPLIAALSIIFYYLLIKEIFGKRNGLFSALTLAVFPPFIYYSARSMFHNALFIVLLIISFYLAVLAVKKVKWFWADSAMLAAGIFTGLAVSARAAELIWLVPVWLAVWLFNLKKTGWLKPLIFLAGALLALTPVFFYNQMLYGSYWRGGYNEMNQSILNMAGAGSDLIKSGAIKSNLILLKDNFFYFGLQPVKSLKMLFYYFAKMFYWLFWSAFLGFAIMLARIKKWRAGHYAYLTALAAASVVLILYYGSWDFHDNPDPKSFTMGNSYVRYWLPIYLGVMPLASIFFLKLTDILKKKFLIYGGRVLILAAIFFISLQFVLAGSDEGLIKSARQLADWRVEYEQVLKATESRAVIITQYHDKLFFPERKVVVGLFDDDNMLRQYAKLLKYLPVYYYNFTFPDKDLNYLNNIKLPPFGLEISLVKKITKDFTLYKLTKIYENRH